MEKCFKTLLLWNHLDNWNQTAQEWSLEGPLQNFCFLCRSESKMAATAIHRLTLDPMGKCSNAFFSETTNIIKAKLYMNVHWMVLYKFSVFYADWKSKMAATTGYSINTGPYGENTEIYSSLKLLHWLNLNCASIIGRSFSNFAGHSFYIGPISSFYNQVNDTGSWEPLVWFTLSYKMTSYCSTSILFTSLFLKMTTKIVLNTMQV